MKMQARFLVIIMILLSATSYAEWTGTTLEQTITYENLVDDSLEVRVTTFCAAPNGYLYAVYAQTESPSLTRELYFSKSTDGGNNWSGTAGDVIINADDGQNVYFSSNYEYIDMQVDSQGRIFIIWCEDYENTGIREIMLLYSTDFGDTWENSTTDVPISNPNGIAYDANKPSLAIDPNDNLHAVWNQKTDSTYNNYEVCYSRSTDNGLTWTGQTADREISYRNGLPAWNPDIDCDGMGNIYVVWNEDAYSGSEFRLQFGKSTDGGATFSSETADTPISLEYQETGAAQIHIDAFDNVNVVYKGSEGDPNFTKLSLYTGSTDGGATWNGNSGLIYVDPGPGPDQDSYGVDITSTSDGTLIAVFSRGASISFNNIFASYSTDHGATWSGNTNPDLVSYSGAVYNSHVPYIVTAPGDTLHVIWRQKAATATKEDLFYSRSDTLAGGGGGGCDYVVGDVNGSDNYNGLDVTYGVNFLKYGTPEPQCTDCPPCSGWHYCGDVNGSCNYNGLDITYGVNYFKYGSPDPVPCGDCPPSP